MHYDVVIVGGSFAGLAAALYLGRARRSVAVLDTGAPRNRFAAHSHGVLTRDGASPLDMLTLAREQMAKYSTVELISAEAVSASGADETFSVGLKGGEVLKARRLVLAFGITDQLPNLPGLAERWGSSVIHCPYCHGYEYADQTLGVLGMSPMSVHQAMLIAEWGPTTLLLNGQQEPDAATLAELDRRGVAIERTPVVGLEGRGTSLEAAVLADGRRFALDALYTGAPTRFNAPLADQLGCVITDNPFGRIVSTDADRLTSVPGVYAVGDIARGGHAITPALGDGMAAATAIHRSFVFPAGVPHAGAASASASRGAAA